MASASSSKASEDILDSVTCSVCKDVYKNPVKISCGHTFCEDCIDRYWATKRNDSNCPFCRKPVHLREKVTDMDMMTLMSNKSTNCRKCKKFLVLTEYRRHERICNGNLTAPLRAGGLSIAKNELGNIYTFVCPYCQQKNLDRESLMAHVNQLHKGDKTQVVCPVCTAMPWGDGNQFSQNFIDHINLRHRFDYERFVDLNQDEQTSLKHTLHRSKTQM